MIDCPDCRQLTGGQCWRHSRYTWVPSPQNVRLRVSIDWYGSWRDRPQLLPEPCLIVEVLPYQPCHADVLLEIANPGQKEEER